MVCKFNGIVEEQLKEESLVGPLESLEQITMERKRKQWTLLSEGWFKINTDAACNDGNAAIAMVVRDDLR